LRARATRALAVMLSVAAIGILADGCVIADPPTPLPALPAMRPTIVRASVVPSVSSVLGTWPTTFIVPVEVTDPLASIGWATFVDFNPASGEGLKEVGIATSGSSSPSGRIRKLELPIAKPSDDQCHVVEIVVALRINTFSGLTAHAPDPPYGDVVTWFYNPAGDVSGCPVIDAGITPLVDAEAGVEGGGGTGQ